MKTPKFITLALVSFFLTNGFVCAQNGPEDDKYFPWKDPNNPNIMLLDGDDPLKEGWHLRRDTSNDPNREAGLFNPQRYEVGLIAMGGFPTFLGAPMALTSEDLKAGGVEIAMVGLNIDDNLIAGGRYAANQLRTLADYQFFGDANYDPQTHTDYLGGLKLADYGNVASVYGHNQRSLEEVHKVMGEILDAGAMPLALGGSHIQMYGIITALTNKYGAGNFAIVHIDAHYDAMSTGFGGRFLHNGNMIYQAVERGYVKGEDIVQIGLRSVKPGSDDLKWMSDNNFKFHFQAEIVKNGWEATLKDVLEEVKGKKVYISFDMDGIDPAYAAAVGTQEPDGISSSNALQLMRALGIQNELVAVDILEYNPLLDDAHGTTGILVDRLMRAVLGGISARKKGITDPFYVHPDLLNKN